METRSAVDFEQYLPESDVWLDVHAFPTPTGLSIFFRDISEARRVREEITYLARHDPLTGLANRVLFHEELRQRHRCRWEDRDAVPRSRSLQGGERYARPSGRGRVALPIGRPAADLRQKFGLGRPAGRGRVRDRRSPRIASGDDASDLAQRILDSVSAPYTIDGQTVRVGASIGIALSPADGADPDQIFKNADIALYTAKAEGRGPYRFFEPAMEERLQEKQKLKTDLTAALAGSEFELVFQPIIDLHSNRVCCFEALLALESPACAARSRRASSFRSRRKPG